MENLPDGVSKHTTRHPPTRKFLPPADGDNVEVRFALKDEAASLKFKLGDGQAMPGLDLAVRHMHQGEHAEFTMPSSLAHGEGDERSRKVAFSVELVSCPVREDLFGDEGAIKTVLKPSEGRPPGPKDECQVSYKIRSSQGLLSSVQSGVYKIGGEQLGQIARVMDSALLSMKLREEAQVSCRPGYVAGDAVAGELVISVVLEEIFLVHDVSLGKLDGTVLRKRVKEGHGEDKLHDTGQVKVNVRSVTSNGEKLPLPPWDLTFRAGDGAVCDALEGAVLTMRQGDEAMLRVLDAAACSGLVASQLEPPIVVHLAVLSVEKVPEKWDLSHAERLDFAARRKELSAELFRRGRTRLAASRYEAIASYVARPEDFKELQPQAAELRRQAWLNQAACLLLLSDHGRVKELCDKVLQEEPQQPKALFRRAKAQLGLAQHQAAAGDLQRLLEIEPQNLPGRQLLKEAKQELRRQDRQTAATFERMVKSLGSLPERERKDDDLVEAPDLDAEYEKLAQQTGVPLNRLKP